MKFDALPFIPEALELAKQGVATGASDRNWKGYGHEVEFQGEEWKRKLLSDPQTSGGLLVACAPEAERAVLDAFRKKGFDDARVIGSLKAGAPKLTVLFQNEEDREALKKSWTRRSRKRRPRIRTGRSRSGPRTSTAWA